MSEKTEYEILLNEEQYILNEIAGLEDTLLELHTDLRHVRSQLIVHAPIV